MLEQLADASRPPALYEPSQAPFWDDPYISRRLLAVHLDAEVVSASRPPVDLDRCVAVLTERGLLAPGRRVLDLGCGPGLVAGRMARAGAHVTGVDISAHSLDYARARAAEEGLEIDYRLQDFRTLEDTAAFDLALQSFGEMSTFDEPERDAVLAAVHRALVPGGVLVMDVCTPALHTPLVGRRDWAVETAGLWRGDTCLVLSETFAYPGDVFCTQYVVLEEDEEADRQAVTAYRMWFHAYLPETLTPVLARAGFDVEAVWGSLTADPWTPLSPWLAVVARAR